MPELQHALTLWLAFARAPAGAVPVDQIVLVHDLSDLPVPPCPGCAMLRTDTAFDGRRPPRAIIFSGHSTFGRYFGMSAPALARLIAEINPTPEFLMLDTCLSAQAELLVELKNAGVAPKLIVAWPGVLGSHGLDYGAMFADGLVTSDELLHISSRGPSASPATLITDTGLNTAGALVEQVLARHADCDLVGVPVPSDPTLVAVPAAGTRGRLLVHIPGQIARRCSRAPVLPPTSSSAWLVVLIAAFTLSIIRFLRRK